MVRGTVALPAGTGKDVRVAVFAQGDAAAAAEAAGAEFVGAEDLAAQIEGGMLDFDVTIATPDLMPLVGKPGPCARPPWPHAQPQDRHRHPRPGQGRRASSRAARSSTAPTATATCTSLIGKASFERRGPEANFAAVIDELNKAKPSSAKGRYIRKVTVASTMGPGVNLDAHKLEA